MVRITITKSADARFLLSLLADAWEFGERARKLTHGRNGLTGSLRGDRQCLNNSAAHMAGPGLENALDLIQKPRRAS